MEKDSLIVNGFSFNDVSDAELARQELKTIKYIDDNINGKSAETIMQVYKGALEKRMFRTPVGYAYLHDMQKRMVDGGIDVDEVPGIPMYQSFGAGSLDDERTSRTVTVNTRKKRDELRDKNRNLRIINIGLLVLIVILFLISYTGSNPTVLNYRTAIENEYSSWQQKLDEREKAVREKERELGIQYE